MHLSIMATFMRVFILASAGWLALAILLFGSRIRANSLGNPPIAKPAFFLAKLGVSVSCVLLILKAALSPPQQSDVASIVCLWLLMGGTLIFTLGLSQLGASLRVGLPREQTSLVRSGIYGWSRNPIYVGIYMIMGVSLLYAFSWLNLAAALAGVALHHRIILSEERFLATQFEEYETYRSKVRRYF